MKTKKLNIAFFGSILVSAYWNGAATYYRGIVRALHERGHHVTFYEPDAYDRQQNRDIPDPDYATVVVYEATEESLGFESIPFVGTHPSYAQPIGNHINRCSLSIQHDSFA